MKLFTLCLSLAFLGAAVLPAAPCLAQRRSNPEAFYRAPDTMHGKTVIIPVGSTIEARMDSTIGSSVSQSGERFTVTVASPVVANGTDVIIPSGAQIMGEVVEAIPHDKLPRKKGYPIPTGKLRVNMNGLKMPDGLTYPIICSLTGETMVMGSRVMANPALGGGIGYMGTAAGFEAVGPNAADAMRRSGRGPQVMNAQQFMRDPIYGTQAAMRNAMRGGAPSIRALVKRHNELYIDEGASVTLKLDAPLKIGVNPTGTAGEAMPALDTGRGSGEGADSGQRFSRTRTPDTPAPAASGGDIGGGGAAGGAQPQVPFSPAAQPAQPPFPPAGAPAGAPAGQGGGQPAGDQPF